MHVHTRKGIPFLPFIILECRGVGTLVLVGGLDLEFLCFVGIVLFLSCRNHCINFESTRLGLEFLKILGLGLLWG